MKRKRRHKRKIELLRKLVKDTDFYVAHVWNDQGNSLHGFVNFAGIQKFRRYGDFCNEWFTPWLKNSWAGRVYFAVMPRSKSKFGTVLQGWGELNYFVNEEILCRKESERAGVKLEC